MLDNPDEHGSYPTTTAYFKLVKYIQEQRMMAVGWTTAEACALMDKGDDIRFHDFADIVIKAQKDLGYDKMLGNNDE